MEQLKVKDLYEDNIEENAESVIHFLKDEGETFQILWEGCVKDIPEEYMDRAVVDTGIFAPEDMKEGIFVKISDEIKTRFQLEAEMQELKEELNAYKATGLTPEKIYMLDRLYTEKCQEVAGYQKQMPRCKTGDLVYFLSKDRQKVESTEVFQICQQNGIFTYYAWDYCFVNENLGEDVFLSEDEARAALELKEGNRNGEAAKESA